MKSLTKFTALDILNDRGFKPISTLNYCTPSGINYYVGFRGDVVAIVAIIEDESNCVIDKNELREMAGSTKIMGINEVILYTNYGLELHSKYENAATVGMAQIIKITSDGYNAKKDLTNLSSSDLFYDNIYPELSREFLFGNKYEVFAQQVQSKFILTPKQWEEVLQQWEQKESILTNDL